MAEGKRDYIEEEELEDVTVKWAWSHFDGRDEFNGPGNYSFVIVLPEEKAQDLLNKGWTGVKQNEGYEEGDPPEWTLSIKISYKYEAPKIYLIKRGRRFAVREERELHDIRRDSCDQIDVIITPSRWVQGPRTGITAYAKELYAQVRESRFAEKYSEYEEI